ncbi:hypothetical protein FOCC_FOCC003784, partial [Frankliniella occidentalis]
CCGPVARILDLRPPSVGAAEQQAQQAPSAHGPAAVVGPPAGAPVRHPADAVLGRRVQDADQLVGLQQAAAAAAAARRRVTVAVPAEVARGAGAVRPPAADDHRGASQSSRQGTAVRLQLLQQTAERPVRHGPGLQGQGDLHQPVPARLLQLHLQEALQGHRSRRMRGPQRRLRRM